MNVEVGGNTYPATVSKVDDAYVVGLKQIYNTVYGAGLNMEVYNTVILINCIGGWL